MHPDYVVLVDMALLGLAGGGLASLVRVLARHALPQEVQALNDSPPLACPVCMAGWSVLVLISTTWTLGTFSLLEFGILRLATVWLGATGLGAVVNGLAVPPAPIEVVEGPELDEQIRDA